MNPKKQLLSMMYMAVFAIVLAGFGMSGCGSDTKEDVGKDAESSVETTDQTDPHAGHDHAAPPPSDLPSDPAWERALPVMDVAQYDTDGDGHLYQDQMCWNVLADEKGSCPKCGMITEKVTIEHAQQMLTDNGMDREGAEPESGP